MWREPAGCSMRPGRRGVRDVVYVSSPSVAHSGAAIVGLGGGAG